MQVTRKGISFTVIDEPVTSSWNFWQLWAHERWEPETFTSLDALLTEGSTLLDVGAWLGPISLWAAKALGAQVIALEPDPEAYRQLCANIEANGVSDKVHPIRVALAPDNGDHVLHYHTLGDSKASLTRSFTGDIITPGITLQPLLDEFDISVVKMDIEGGEHIVMPKQGILLRERNIPLLLAMHWGTADPDDEAAMHEELIHWEMTDITDASDMFLCRPK